LGYARDYAIFKIEQWL